MSTNNSYWLCWAESWNVDSLPLQMEMERVFKQGGREVFKDRGGLLPRELPRASLSLMRINAAGEDMSMSNSLESFIDWECKQIKQTRDRKGETDRRREGAGDLPLRSLQGRSNYSLSFSGKHQRSQAGAVILFRRSVQAIAIETRSLFLWVPFHLSA